MDRPGCLLSLNYYEGEDGGQAGYQLIYPGTY